MICGSAFSGVGLLDYGLTLAGFKHAWLCEKDEYRRGILAQRWPGARILDDVRHVGHGCEPVTLFAGGFPCKGASTAGKRTGFSHPVVWDCLPAGAVGAPHLRDRVFAVATYAAGEPREAGTAARASSGRAAGGGHGSAPDPDGSHGLRLAGDGRRQDGRQDARGVAEDASDSEGERRSSLAAVEGGQGVPAAVGAGRGRAAVAADAVGDAVWDESEPERGCGRAPIVGRTGEALADPHGFRDEEEQARSLSIESERATHRRRAVELARAGGHGEGAGGGVPGALSGARGLAAGDRSVGVDWGEREPAIRRWEAVHGPAPEPLVRRMDDRRAARVERSRLSALGDGVQVQIGWIVGEYIVGLERDRLMKAAA